MREQTIATIREFKTPNFRIVIDAIEDYDVDLSFDDTGEILKQLERGDLVSFTVRALVYCRGSEVASDYLGGCIYATPQEFMDHRQCAAQTRKLRAEGSTAVCGSYFSDMVREVCRSARTELAKFHAVRVRV